MLQMFSPFAQFERNRIREPIQEGLERSKAQVKNLSHDTTLLVQEKKAEVLFQFKVA
ncbi:hypothetical protein VCHA40P242_120011 [Vibrio chagasii]|nr:hypothetical protein VCHA36P164_140091 [Vibrio chagasii]CAH6905320.1 hypothetical protein VCHA40P242_120011 [Vibrio chagasii]